MNSLRALQAVKINPELIAKPVGEAVYDFLYIYNDNGILRSTGNNLMPDTYLADWEVCIKKEHEKGLIK